MRLLLVEDDPMIGEGVRKGLRQDGFTVDWVQDGPAAELAVSNDVYGLVVLDLGLPRKDGLDVLAALRRKGNSVPVLILTARDAVADRIKGLDAGADDYVLKPFDSTSWRCHPRFLAGARAGRTPSSCAGTHAQYVHREARHRGKEVAPRRASSRCSGAAGAPGILSRAQLEERLYGWGEEVESNAVEVYIHSLRRKLGADFIRNVRGVGYRVAKR
jgi:two-component system response regulator QseB